MIKSLLIILVAFLCGCSMPVSAVRTIDDRPSITISGASEGAELFIDGVFIGKANKYDRQPNVLKVESGTHRVKVMDQGSILYDKDVFVESELKTITIR